MICRNPQDLVSSAIAVNSYYHYLIISIVPFCSHSKKIQNYDYPLKQIPKTPTLSLPSNLPFPSKSFSIQFSYQIRYPKSSSSPLLLLFLVVILVQYQIPKPKAIPPIKQTLETATTQPSIASIVFAPDDPAFPEELATAPDDVTTVLVVDAWVVDSVGKGWVGIVLLVSYDQ